jgi:Mannosyltransferase (PIG-V)
VWVAGMFGIVQFGVSSVSRNYDPVGLTTPFGNYLANVAVGPLARWDSYWYLSIARYGYEHSRTRMVYFPLYPLLINVLGWVVSSELIAGVLISLVAFAVGLILLQRLVRLDFDDEVARATVMLIAFSPMAFFFSAVYTESLFLALSVGAFYCARRERWLLAGVLGGLAALSRNGGAVLILPLAWIYLYGDRDVGLSRWARAGRSGVARCMPRNRLELNLGALLLIPAGLGLYLAYLGLHYGDALAPFRAETFWYRHTTFPLVTVGRGLGEAWNGFRQLVQGPRPPYRVADYAASEVATGAEDILLFGFLLLGLLALVMGLRRLPVAYSIYVFFGLVLALSDPVKFQSLASLPRYELVLFPCFIWAARVLVQRQWMLPVVAVSAVLLGICTVEFSTWHWIA